MIYVPYDLKSDATSNVLRLSRWKIIKKSLAANVIILMLLILLWAVYPLSPATFTQAISPFLTTDTTIVMFLLSALVLSVLGINILYQYLYFKTYYYNLKSDVIVIRKGVFRPDEISIPYNRIQDVFVDRDFFDIVFGLYDVHISSATAVSGLEAHIDGVANPNALKIKDMILDNMKAVSPRVTEDTTPL